VFELRVSEETLSEDYKKSISLAIGRKGGRPSHCFYKIEMLFFSATYFSRTEVKD
jgi:hypothetical protein